MTRDQERLWGELISLARITDGNRHLITARSTALLRRCLGAIAAGTPDAEALCQDVIEEKHHMVPDCFACANPCGKTFPFDFREIPAGEEGTLKYAILEALCRNPDVKEPLLYNALTVVSLGGYENEELLSILNAIEQPEEEYEHHPNLL